MRTTIVTLALVASGCAASTVYAPIVTEEADTIIAGKPAARYPIPTAGAPHGELRVGSLGLAGLGDPSHPIQALHVRMIVANDGPIDWTLDTREQRIVLGEGQETTPAYATELGASSTPPRVRIPAHGQAIVELFFPLPDGQQRTKPPRFDVRWSLHTDAGPVAARTEFERLRITSQYASTAPYFGPGNWAVWGPTWWYDPYYPWWAWAAGRPTVERPINGRPLVVYPPRWHR